MLQPLHPDDLNALIALFADIAKTPLRIKRASSPCIDLALQNPDVREWFEEQAGMARYEMERDFFATQEDRLRQRYGNVYVAMFKGVPAVVGEHFTEVAKAFHAKFGIEAGYIGGTFMDTVYILSPHRCSPL